MAYNLCEKRQENLERGRQWNPWMEERYNVTKDYSLKQIEEVKGKCERWSSLEDTKTIVPEIIDTVLSKTSPKRSFSMTEYERFGLVFTKTRVYKFGHRMGLGVIKADQRWKGESLVSSVVNPDPHGSASFWEPGSASGFAPASNKNPDPHQFANDKPKMYGLKAYLSTFSRVRAFYWKLEARIWIRIRMRTTNTT